MMSSVRLLAMTLVLVTVACTAAPPPPTHFGRWGPITPIRDPERAVILAALAALPAEEAHATVLARYAGDRDRRLDLAPIAGESPVGVDAADKLAPIDTGMPEYRHRVFEYDFPTKTTILELSVPAIRGDSATLTAWHWSALEWKCALPGIAETVTLRRAEGGWVVTGRTPQRGSVRIEKDCPARTGAVPQNPAASNRPASRKEGGPLDPARVERLAVGYTAAWCSREPARVASFFGQGGSLQINGGPPAVGRAAIEETVRGFMTAFPDLVVTMDQVVSRGPAWIYRWTLIGTNTGPGGTGRPVRISGYEEWTIGGDGSIERSLGHFDEADYRRQLSAR